MGNGTLLHGIKKRKEKKKTPSYFPKSQALLLIEPKLLHAEYVSLVSIWLRKCSKHTSCSNTTDTMVSTCDCLFASGKFQGSGKSLLGIQNGTGGEVLKILSNS